MISSLSLRKAGKLCLHIFCIWLLVVCLPAIAGDLTLHRTGLRPPTDKDRAWMASHLIRTQSVALNDIGLQRVNSRRKVAGLPALPMATAVPRGQEVNNPHGVTVKGSALPASVDNSQSIWFPPVGDQGGVGSCASFSATYYTGTYMLAMARNIDAQHGGDATHLSPKWTYNMIDGGQDGGSWMTTAYQVMLDHGCATWQQFPYVGSDYPASNFRAWCTDPAVWRSAINIRMNQTGSVDNVDTATGLTNLKTMLANGYLLNYATGIGGWNYTKITAKPGSHDNDNYIGQQACTYNNGPMDHGMTVVGYDDNLWIDINGNGQVDPGETGALLVVNNWSAGWGTWAGMTPAALCGWPMMH